MLADKLKISIHSLRMEGDLMRCAVCGAVPISIHSLRMEGDFHVLLILLRSVRFQSTPSAWRETDFIVFSEHRDNISIHSLRMEGDITDKKKRRR